MVTGEDDAPLARQGWGMDWETTRANLFGEEYDSATGDVGFVPGPVLIDERDALLSARDMRVTDEGGALLLDDLGQLYLAYIDRLQRRDGGDFGPDPVLVTLPPVDVSLPASAEGKPVAVSKPAVSITDLFERYAKSGAASLCTVSKWRPHVRHFVEHLGHDDATRVTRGDMNRWVEVLVAKSLSKGTITDSYIPAVRLALGIAYEDELIPSNPAMGLKVRAPKAKDRGDKDHSDEAVKAILTATLAQQPKGLAERHKLARR